MKNNRRKYIFFITAVIFGFIIIFIIVNNKTSNENIQSNTNAQEVKTMDNNSNIKTEDLKSQTALNASPPKWAQEMMDINNNPTYSREQKIDLLVNLLKKNASDPEALTDILISLTGLNPIEAADDIIPYLQNANPRVQSAALGALNNASLLTQEEHRLKQALPENEQVRKRIAEAVNNLKTDPKTSDNVKQALVSTYAATNRSVEDTKKMNQEILIKDKVSINEASYVASTILNGKDLADTLKVLNSKSSDMKDSIISSIGASLLDNPNVISALSSEQKAELTNFISKNPPLSSNPNDFSYQNDQWKNTLSVLNNF